MCFLESEKPDVCNKRPFPGKKVTEWALNSKGVIMDLISSKKKDPL